MTSLIGQTINDRYRLDALLGDGGMGTVFRAFDRNLDRQVAIKLMHSHFARQPEFRKRLIQEAQTAAKLDHPSIVRIYDFGESELGLFITMEYVDGGSLREHLQRLQTMGKFLPFSQSMQIGIQIDEALDYAHRRGVIHRDVKPGNIILKRLSHPDEPGEQPFRAVLTDFGLVKLQEGIPMTQSGATVGTPAYMSPEQCEGMELDGRSDLYSLGIVLYELVTNRLPFTFQSLADAISTHRRGTRPAPPSEYRADAPPLIDGLLAKSVAKAPDDRFSSGFEMATALRSAKLSLEGTPTRIMTRQELNILDRVEDPPEGYELEINAPGHQASVMSLIHSVVTLGRNADNDVVLPADGVSRHHARLQATSLGWEVLDLGGPNGTWLDDRRLRPQEPTPLLPGATLRVGPYELELMAPDVSASALAAGLAAGAAAIAAADTTVPGATTRGLPENGTAAPLAVYPIQDTIEVDPGQQADIKVEVINRGSVDDRIGLRVQGIPNSWITTPTSFVPIKAGETIEMTVGISPPHHQSTPVGRQRVLFELISQHYPEVDASATLNLVINPIFTFSAALEPQQMRLPGTATISVQNTGSASGEFSVLARDTQDALEFTGEKGRIALQPGQVAHVNLEVKARESSFFDSDDIYPYEVNVVSRSGGRQQLSAEAIAGGLIPPWLLYALIFLTTICCAALALAAFLNRDRLFTPAPTATLPFAGLAATQTAAALTQTAVYMPGGTITPTIDGTGNTNGSAAVAFQEIVINADSDPVGAAYDKVASASKNLASYTDDPAISVTFVGDGFDKFRPGVLASSLFSVSEDSAIAAAEGVAYDMVGSANQNLVSYTDDPAIPFTLAGDGFNKFQRGVSASIPFSVIDDSAGAYPADTQGIIKSGNTDVFFGIVDTNNGDTGGRDVVATWVFDISGASNLSLSIAMGAMGDFQANADFFNWSYSIDGGAAQIAFQSSVNEGASQTYTMEDGNTITIDDPMLINGVLLNNDLRAQTVALNGSGSRLTLILTANLDDGSETGMKATATRLAATAEAQGDSDGDGLSNAQEEFIGTDPFNPDSDADGLTDGQEVLIYGTDPLHVDTDRDGYTDGHEVLILGTDPLNPNDPPSGPQPPTTMPPGTPSRTRPPWVTPKPPIPTRTYPPTMPPPATSTLPPPVPTQTSLPTITLTPIPTSTPETPTITPTPTETATPTLTPTATDVPVGPAPSVACAVSPPTIDGVFDPAEWPASPMAQFSAASNPSRSVELYFSKDSSSYYLAYLINDPVVDPSDTVRTGFDTNASGGDPDGSDRYFIVNRDGSSEVWAGVGSSSDSLLWDASYASGDWSTAVGESAAQWVVEIEIDSIELVSLANPFAMMSQAQSTSDLATWPGAADSNSLGTWQPVVNPVCP